MLPVFAWAGNRLALALRPWRRRSAAPTSLARPNLTHLAQAPAALPQWVADDPIARKYLELLGPLDWDHFPERPTRHPWPGPAPAPRAPYVAAFLVKLNEGLCSLGHLRRYLVEHPVLVWSLGFPLVPDPTAPHGFDVERSLPCPPVASSAVYCANSTTPPPSSYWTVPCNCYAWRCPLL